MTKLILYKLNFVKKEANQTGLHRVLFEKYAKFKKLTN